MCAFQGPVQGPWWGDRDEAPMESMRKSPWKLCGLNMNSAGYILVHNASSTEKIPNDFNKFCYKSSVDNITRLVSLVVSQWETRFVSCSPECHHCVTTVHVSTLTTLKYLPLTNWNFPVTLHDTKLNQWLQYLQQGLLLLWICVAFNENLPIPQFLVHLLHAL